MAQVCSSLCGTLGATGCLRGQVVGVALVLKPHQAQLTHLVVVEVAPLEVLSAGGLHLDESPVADAVGRLGGASLEVAAIRRG